MFKVVQLLVVIVFSFSFVFGQLPQNIGTIKPNIFILSVVHNENEYRNADSLLNIIKDIKPHLLLSETDTLSGYFKPGYTLVPPPKWYKFAWKVNVVRKMPPEMDVIYRYKEINDSVKVYPFDIAIQNRNKYVNSKMENENQWMSSVNAVSVKNQIPDSILSKHKEYILYNNWIYEAGQRSYRYINRAIVTDSIRRLMQIEADYFPRLMNSIPSLSNYKNWYDKESEFWKLRNETMAKNIINLTEKTNAKKVVVFTGLLHKYYLIDLLKAYDTEGKYELIEYYQK
jgi:hypothetical protein